LYKTYNQCFGIKRRRAAQTIQATTSDKVVQDRVRWCHEEIRFNLVIQKRWYRYRCTEMTVSAWHAEIFGNRVGRSATRNGLIGLDHRLGGGLVPLTATAQLSRRLRRGKSSSVGQKVES